MTGQVHGAAQVVQVLLTAQDKNREFYRKESFSFKNHLQFATKDKALKPLKGQPKC